MIAPTAFFSDRGSHIRIFEEIRALDKLGHKITLLTYHLGQTPRGLHIKRIPKVPLYHRFGDHDSKTLPSGLHYLLDFLLFLKTLKAIITLKPEVLHCHFHMGVVIGKLAKGLTFSKALLVADIQESLTQGMVSAGPLGMKFTRQFEKWALNSADQIVVSSPSTADTVLSFGVSQGKVTLVQDGTAPHILESDHTAEERKKVRARLGIAPSDKVVLYTGSFGLGRGVKYLFEAMPHVLERNIAAMFLLCGYPGQERWQEEARRLQVSARTIFTGRISYFNAYKYLMAADVAVDPKPSESAEVTIKLKNYMATGLPIVCFDTENNLDALGGRGIYANDADANDLADKIVWALENLSEVKKTAREFKKEAADRFSWEISARILDRLYKMGGEK